MNCYNPIKGVDDVIGRINGWTPEITALLRGIYDEKLTDKNKGNPDAPKTLDVSDISKAAAELKRYNDAQKRLEHMNKLSTNKTIKTADRRTAIEHYKSKVLSRRISAMVTDFQSVVMQIAQQSGKSIVDICNGWTLENGQFVAGQFAIFEFIRDNMLNQAANYTAEAARLASPEIEKTEENLKALEIAKHRAEEYTKIIAHWNELVTLTRIRLRDTMGTILGNKVEYATELGVEMELDNLHYNPEESTREHWLTKQDEISSYLSSSQAVKLFLSTIPVVNETELDSESNPIPETDDLGYIIYNDPVSMHRELMNLLRGTTTSKQIETRLKKLSEEHFWIKNVYKKLYRRDIDNSLLRTQFFVDFRKSFQLYGALEKKIGENGIVYNTMMLNRLENTLKGDVKARVVRGLVINPDVSVYTDKAIEFKRVDPKTKKAIVRKGAALNLVNLRKLADDISKHFDESVDDATGDVSTYYEGLNTNERVNFIVRTFEALGIPADKKSVKKLLSNREDSARMVDALKGVDRVLRSQFKDYLDVNSIEDLDSSLAKTYIQLLEDDDFAEHVDKLSELASNYSLNQQFENRALWQDPNGRNITLFSDVQPSYLADKIDELHSFIENGDVEGLKNYIFANWGISPYFYQNGRYLNRWMHDFVKEGLDSNGIGANFGFMKFVGEKNKIDGDILNFENFTMDKHAVSMIDEFSSFRQISKGTSNMAYYPVFILGDANVQKYIKAPIYPLYEEKVISAEVKGGKLIKKTSAPILDSLYDVFLQEQTFSKMMSSVRDMMTKKKEDGGNEYTEIVSYKAKSKVADNAREGKFQFLTFLNADYVSATGEVGSFYNALQNAERSDGSYNERLVKNIIKDGMNDAFQKFLDNMADNGVLEGKAADMNDAYRQGKYKSFTDIHNYFKKDIRMMDPNNSDETNLREFLREFFWNTKFATIQQMQMFTINPAFYKDSKELQKRYKELHAPGNALDIYAEYFDGHEYKRYSEDGIETAVYFKDIALNSAIYNKEYADSVAYQCGLQTEEIRKDLNEGASLSDSKFVDKIIRIGRNTEMYKKYATTDENGNPIVDEHGNPIDESNSLTDGQGYRTIDSYYKVLGMAGLLNDDIKSFYKQLKEAREQYHNNIPENVIADLVAKSKAVLQPIKPYMYGIEHYEYETGKHALIPVQHKYSEVVIIPELLPKGSKLRELALWMENHTIIVTGENGSPKQVAQPIDVLLSSYVVKTGEWGVVDIKGKMNMIDKNENVTNDLTNTLNSAAVHKFKYSDYRIQSNVPYHANTDRLFGTQLRKLIMSNLAMSKDYSDYTHGRRVNLGGDHSEVVLTGRNLLAFYNSLIVSNILDSFEEFASEVENQEKLADVLTQAIINNSRFSMNCIDAFVTTGDSRFMLPLFEAAFEHDTASMIFSIFKNRVNRQKIKGGALVQVSSLGINKLREDDMNEFGVDYGGLKDRTSLWDKEDENGNVILGKYNPIYSEIAVPFDLSVNKNGRNVPLKYEDYVNSDGIPKFGKKYGGDLTLAKARLEQNRNAMPEDEFSQKMSELKELMDLCQSFQEEVNGEYHIFQPLIEQHYKGILTRIAYRIPTENDYSMVMGRVVRFTSPVAGGIIMVPAHGTSRSGWDFDIDKLYFMMFEYVEKGLNMSKIDELIENDEEFKKANAKLSGEKLRNSYVWSKIYADNPGLTEALSAARDNIFSRIRQIENEAKAFSSTESGMSPIMELQEATSLNARDYDSDASFVEQVKDINEHSPFDSFNGYNISYYIRKAEEFLANKTETKDEWTKLFKDKFGEDSDIFKLIKNHITDRGVDFSKLQELHKYWKFAGKEGNTGEIFKAKVEDLVGGPALDEYDFTKSPLENSKAARNNMILEIVQKRLMDNETFMARNTPGGFDNASVAARNMRQFTLGNYNEFVEKDVEGNITGINSEKLEAALKGKDPEPNYDATDPWTIIVYNAQNQLASKLIGIMANQNANHALATLMEELRLNVPIEFCDHTVDGDGIGIDLLHKHLDKKKLADGKSIYDLDPQRAERIKNNVAEFLAASVDAVKDPVLNFLNLNTLTAAPGLLLARLGYTAEEIGLLFNQPIIKEICNEYFKASRRTADNVISSVISRYEKSNRDNIAEKDFGKTSLQLNILKARAAMDKGESLLGGSSEIARDFTDSQVRIAEMFSNIVKASAELNSFITATKFTAANAVGTTPGAFYNQQQRVLKYIEKIKEAESSNVDKKVNKGDEGPTTMLSMVVSGEFNENTGTVTPYKGGTLPVQTDIPLEFLFSKSKAERAENKQKYIDAVINNPFAYEQVMYDANKKCIEILEKYYPYGTRPYKELRSLGNDLMRDGVLREEEINALHQEWMVYLLSQQEDSIFNGGNYYGVIDGNLVTNRDYYKNYFAELLKQFLEDPDVSPELAEIKELPIFKSMLFDVDNFGNWNMRILGATSRADYSRDEIIESWDDLSKMGEEGMSLAKDLFMYCFYNHGYKYGYNNFMFMCPVSVKTALEVTEGKTYRDFLYDVLDGKIDANKAEFFKLFISNHSDDYRWVYRPYGSAKESLTSYLTTGSDAQFQANNGELTALSTETGEVRDSFELDLSRFNNDDDKKTFLRDNKSAKNNKQYAFIPAIMIDGHLYIADNGDAFNVTTNGKQVMRYSLYDTLGRRGENMSYLSAYEADVKEWRHTSGEENSQD